jgi:hypothetical protein
MDEQYKVVLVAGAGDGDLQKQVGDACNAQAGYRLVSGTTSLEPAAHLGTAGANQSQGAVDLRSPAVS